MRTVSPCTASGTTSSVRSPVRASLQRADGTSARIALQRRVLLVAEERAQLGHECLQPRLGGRRLERLPQARRVVPRSTRAPKGPPAATPSARLRAASNTSSSARAGPARPSLLGALCVATSRFPWDAQHLRDLRRRAFEVAQHDDPCGWRAGCRRPHDPGALLRACRRLVRRGSIGRLIDEHALPVLLRTASVPKARPAPRASVRGPVATFIPIRKSHV